MAAKAANISGETPTDILVPRVILMLSVFALTLIGLVMIYSTSSVIALSNSGSMDTVGTLAATFDQLKFAVIGIVIAFIVWKFVPCRIWRSDVVWIIWAAAVVLLIATKFSGAGEEDWGAQRWLVLGPISLQPSEFAKIALVLVAARLFDEYREGKYAFFQFVVIAGVLLLGPVLIILGLQSDLGTAMICVVGVFAVMWLGEVPWRTLLGIAVLIVVIGFIGVFSSDYRRARMMVFMNPWEDGEGGYGYGYQIIHSLYALASGGLFGVGLGNSHEKYLYLTQSETDFIFAIIGEELGLIGALVVIALFLALLYAGMRIARSSPDSFGTMVAGGCTIMITFQAFLNIAMVIGWFPVVGKPLPFVSSGGSSLIATFIMVGLILSVSQGAAAESGVYERRRSDLRVVRAQPAQPRESSRPSKGRGKGGGGFDASSIGSPSTSSRSSSGGISWDAVSSRGSKKGGGMDPSHLGSGRTSRKGRR